MNVQGNPGGVGKKATREDLAENALSEYVKFLLVNLGKEKSREHLVEGFNNSGDSIEYKNIDKRFLSLTLSDRRESRFFSGINDGKPVSWMLLSDAGIKENDIDGLKNFCVDLAEKYSGDADLENIQKNIKLPSIKKIDDMPLISRYESEIDVGFFNKFDENGPEIFRDFLKQQDMNPDDFKIFLEHNPSDLNSNRITDRITLVKDDREVASYYMKVAKSDLEKKASEYASERVVQGPFLKKHLGPRARVMGDYIIEEDLEYDGDSLRKTGSSLTKGESLSFGFNRALELVAMVSDKKFMYKNPAPTHICLTGKGRQDLKIRLVGWDASEDISNLSPDELEKKTYAFMMSDAHLMRGELQRETNNFVSWGAYKSILTDPRYVQDGRMRGMFLRNITKVEDDLKNPGYTRGGIPIGEDGAERWKSFFDNSEKRRSLPEDTRGEVERQFLQDQGVVDQIERTLALDLQRSNILAPEVSKKLVDDLIYRVRIQDQVGIPGQEVLEIMDSTINKVNNSQKRLDDSRRYEITDSKKKSILESLEIELRDKTIFSIMDMSEPLARALKSSEVDPRAFADIPPMLDKELTARCMSKISFEEVTGEVSWLRPWAKHILVKGPEPTHEILSVYRFKPTHTRSPKTEIIPSETASIEDIGPKVVWSKELDDRNGIVLEEYITPISAKTLNSREIIETSKNLATMTYRMHSFDRFRLTYGKSIHSFDGFERGHFNIRRQGGDLKPCFIDYGEPFSLDRRNRPERLTQNLGTLLEVMKNDWPDSVTAVAVFEKELHEMANSRPGDSNYRVDLLNCLKEVRKEKTEKNPSTMLGKRWVDFFKQVDKVKKELDQDEGMLNVKHLRLIPVHGGMDEVASRWDSLVLNSEKAFENPNEILVNIKFFLEKSQNIQKLLGPIEDVVGFLSRKKFRDNRSVFNKLVSGLRLDSLTEHNMPERDQVVRVIDAIEKNDNPEELMDNFEEIRNKVEKRRKQRNMAGVNRIRPGARKKNLGAGGFKHNTAIGKGRKEFGFQEKFWEELIEELNKS